VAFTIAELAWDEEAEEHIARHSVTIGEVEQAVFDGPLHTYRVGRDRIAVVGQTAGGRYLTVFLDDEGDGLWYPVTARASTDGDRRLARRKGRGGRR
jgi:uncharacterized DUF497 family protein